MEVSQSVQQKTIEQFHTIIKDQSSDKHELAKSIVQILENISLNTFSEFLQLQEINEVFISTS